MTFNKRSRRASGRLSGAVGSVCAAALLGVARAAVSLSMVAVLAGLVLFVQLSQGPVKLPGLSRYVVDRVNSTSESVRIKVDTAVFNLGDGSVASGLEFRDVEVTSIDGEPLFTVPRLRARFDFIDLVRGRILPTRISVVSADAQFSRLPDGRVRFGLGSGPGVPLEAEDESAAKTSERGSDAISLLVDAIVGDRELPDIASKLRVMEVRQARIVFTDRRAGGRVVTRQATLRIRRDAGGATALLDISGRSGTTPGELVRMVANRRKGAGFTSVAGRFGQLDLKKLTNFLPALEILNDVDAIAEGELQARFNRDGSPLRVAGRIYSDGGSLKIGSEVRSFHVASVSFEADLPRGVIKVTDGVISAPGFDGRAKGVIDVVHDAGGAVAAARAQLDVTDIALHKGTIFDDQVIFDHGQIVAAWTPDGNTIEIGQSWLGTGDLNLRLRGRISALENGVGVDLRAETEKITVQEVIRHWPRGAVENARAWIAENISQGVLHDMTAQVRIRPDVQLLALNAGFSEVTSTYVEGMSPIRDATGDLVMDIDHLFLNLSSGGVVVAGKTLSLAGSSMVISKFEEPITPAAVNLRGRAETETVLALIDQEPLGLVRALGIDLGRIGGRADVTARVTFPLLKDLRIRDVDVDVGADLSDTRLTLPVGEARTVNLRANQLSIRADTNGMRLRGDASFDGTPVNVDWREDFASRPGRRQIRLAGRATPKLLSEAGLEGDFLTGHADLSVDLTQRGKDPMRFALDANLRDAGLTIPPIGWSKARGDAGGLRASGSLGPQAIIEKLDLEAPGLRASGEITFRPDGAIRRALFQRIVMPDRIDASVSFQSGEDGVADVRIAGALLDVSDTLEGGESDAPPKAMRVRLELDRLKVTENIVINAAEGNVQRLADGAVSGRVTGALGPDAPVAVSLDIPARGEGRVVLKSSNAGAALRHAGIYRGATGGELRVDARLPEGGGKGVSGQARIDNVTVRSEATFRDVLEDGGLREAGDVVSGSGLSFRSISVPFEYRDGIVTVTDAIAVSPMLGLKMTGTVNENTDAVDLIGVLSPAYALTGALNEIPLLGQILSGGRGEGIIGMTFTLKGAMADPQFSVNPLSLLAPGLLRKMFTGGGTPASKDFKPQGSPQQR